MRVLIADDHRLYREQLELAIGDEDDLTLVGAAADGTSALTLIERLTPDVALVDLRMPGIDGLELCRRARATRVVLLTAFHEPELISEARRAGAVGYLCKSAATQDICAAVRTAGGGEAGFVQLE